MGFFNSFKKKPDGQQNNNSNEGTSVPEETTEEIVDDKVYVRDTPNATTKEKDTSITSETTNTSDSRPSDYDTEEKDNSVNNEQSTKQEDQNTNHQQNREFPNNQNESTEDPTKVNQTKTIPANVKRSQYAPAIVQEDVNTEDTEKEQQTAEKLVTNNKEDNTAQNNSYSEHNVDKTLIISILNQKGGVGKSTTAINLAAALGEVGKKCLLVDLDPQGNTSSGLGIEKNGLKKCIYDVLLNDTNIKEVIVKDACKGVDVVPATINLAGAEVELVSEIAREQRLKEALNIFDKEYDYIFVDCPPSLGLLTVNALVAANQLIIPIQCEFYALEGVTKLLDSMKRVKNRLNPNLDIFGVVLTMYDNRTTLSKQVAEEVQNFFGDKVFESKIPRTVKISEAPSFGIPINEYEPLCKGTIMYESLAEEVINRG